MGAVNSKILTWCSKYSFGTGEYIVAHYARGLHPKSDCFRHCTTGASHQYIVRGAAKKTNKCTATSESHLLEKHVLLLLFGSWCIVTIDTFDLTFNLWKLYKRIIQQNDFVHLTFWDFIFFNTIWCSHTQLRVHNIAGIVLYD